MEKEIKRLTQPEINNQESVLSKLIADWIKIEAEKGMMLPKSSEEIEGKLSAGEAFVAWNKGEPVGYCELLIWTPRVVEIGGLIVRPDKRRQGIGSSLVLEAAKSAREDFPGATIFCLAENEISQRLFEKLGGRVFSKELLPESVWSICPDCAHYLKFPNQCSCKAINLGGLL